MKLSRNGPCLCGSKIKFKKCHGKSDVFQAKTASLASADQKRLVDGVADFLARFPASRAGFVMDEFIRSCIAAMNARVLTQESPVALSFQPIIQAFCQPNQKYPVFDVRRENDHLFSFSDFIDFVTSAECDVPLDAAARTLTEGEIYSYNNLDDPADISLTSAGHRSFVLGGLSLVRHASELTVVLIAGERGSLEQEQARFAKPWQAYSETPLRTVLGSPLNPELKQVPLPSTLFETPGLYQRVVALKCFLGSSSTLCRYVMFRGGGAFLTVTDDPGFFDHLRRTAPTQIEQWDDAVRTLDDFQVLFEICKLAPLISAYFRFKFVLVRQEPAPMTMSAMEVHRDTPSHPYSPPPDDPSTPNVVFKKVAALRVVGASSGRIAWRVSAPQFRVEVSGFWRVLAASAIGRGPDGRPEFGRTWVRKHVRWRSRPERPVTVLVKSRFAATKRDMFGGLDKARVVESTSNGSASPTRESPVVSRESLPASKAVDSNQGNPGTDSQERRRVAFEERRKLTANLRYTILERDDFRCQSCGADAASDANVRLEVDHVLSVFDGGTTVPENLRTLCRPCNAGKGRRSSKRGQDAGAA